MPSIEVVELVSHDEMFRSNADANLNVYTIDVTWLTSQAERSLLMVVGGGYSWTGCMKRETEGDRQREHTATCI